MEFIKKLIKTKRDLSVWIMASYWLALNLIAILIWGSFGTVFSNIIGLGTIAAFTVENRREGLMHGRQIQYFSISPGMIFLMLLGKMNQRK